MTYPTVQFVDAAEVGATVRFDFNDGTATVNAEGYSLGTPSLEGEPDGIGAEWGFRRLAFTMEIEGTKAVALAKQSALARELMRQTNWLLFQLTATSDPVWFKTYRTAPGEISLERVYEDGQALSDVWAITVGLDAEPFAYGERVTIGPVTVNNDPAHATNPVSYALPTITGDTDTPLVVTVTPSSVAAETTIFLANSVVDGTFSAPVVWQTTTATAHTDTGAETALSTFSGGTYRAVTFATDSTLVSRLLFTTMPTVPRVGRHKVLVRVAASGSTSTYTLQGYQMIGGVLNVPGEEVLFDPEASGSGQWHGWVDLGDFSFPAGFQGSDSTVGAAVTATDWFGLKASRDTGTAELRIDCFMIVPVEVEGYRGTTLKSDVNLFSFGTWDGEAETFYVLDGGSVGNIVAPVHRGGFPAAVPGAGNRLHLLVSMAEGNGSVLDNITMTSGVTVSYHPRFLYLADG